MNINSFTFEPSGYGHFKVTYKTPSGKQYTVITSDMPLIDLTLHSDNPKKKDLFFLKKICKSQKKY